MTANKVVLECTALRDRSADLLREVYAATGPLHAEAIPDMPRVSLERWLSGARSLSAAEDGATIVARDSTGQIIGSADVTTQDIDGFRHIAEISIGVLAGHRRAGIGRALLSSALDVTERLGRTLLTGAARETVPAGDAFARRIGAELGMVLTENRLDLRAIDRDLVRSWVEAGPVRAPGYHLEFINGPTPDQLLPRVVAAFRIMNTAPREDLQVDDFTITAEVLRDAEQSALAAGFERWACYAVDDATGDFVGLTDIAVYPAEPERVHVGNTAVEPAHRGRALGKWLKGAITQQVLDQVPGARWMVTNNAASNDAMLSINRQLGFRASAEVKMWQVSTERVRAYLENERRN